MEKETGQAILDFCQSSGIVRSEIFYTTKLKLNCGNDHVRRAIEKSLSNCGLGYIDLYLIHGPVGGPTSRLESWRAICNAQKEGTYEKHSIWCTTYRGDCERESPVTCHQSTDTDGVFAKLTCTRSWFRKDVLDYSKAHGIALEILGRLYGMG
ncbi:hypothetical protein L208DRAFT_1381190 [Tricholoma matsutake]|nr:hypothetical protein L208DRAFT_1381190 [Tricholoma matsutake 945]